MSSVYRVTTSERRNKGNKGGTERIGSEHMAKCIVLANYGLCDVTVERMTGEWEDVSDQFRPGS